MSSTVEKCYTIEDFEEMAKEYPDNVDVYEVEHSLWFKLTHPFNKRFWKYKQVAFTYKLF